jgi:hypothetical protein
MRLCHTQLVAGATFDEPNLVSAAGLVPVMRLAADAGLGELAAEHLTVPTDKGANVGGKVTALVCGMVAGADSIDDMALLRHGAMGRLFDRPYAPSTLGSFLRAMSFGHSGSSTRSRPASWPPTPVHRYVTALVQGRRDVQGPGRCRLRR